MDVYKVEKIPFRLLLYGLMILYLAVDLIFHGPIHHRLSLFLPGSETSQQRGIDLKWAALVNGKPITKAQLNLAVDIFLARRGQTRADLSRQNLHITQLAVLNDMINDELVRQWSAAQPVPVPDEFLENRVEQFRKHFLPAELSDVSEIHRLSPGLRTALLENHARQHFWVESKISEAVEVTDQEMRDWYNAHKEDLQLPEIVRARHIFLTTVGKDPEKVREEIERIHNELTEEGKNFIDLAAQYSEDERTKNKGGDLGYFSRNRLPADFTDPVFALKPGEVSEPFQTSIGWHIAGLLEQKPARSLSFEELKPEIYAHLETTFREDAVDRFIEQLRSPRWANVEIFVPAGELD